MDAAYPVDPELDPAESDATPATTEAGRTDRAPLEGLVPHSAELPEQRFAPSLNPSPPRMVPNFGDAVLFTLLAGCFIFVVQAAFFSATLSFHLLPHQTTAQLAREPRLIVPSMALAYVLTLLMAALVFPLLWNRGFASGIRWNGAAVMRLGWRLPALGLAVGVTAQLLQNYLPMPKTVPMDDYFKTRADVWIVTVFGTLLAPVFEEVAFRGMLLPAVGNAWDWIANLASPGRRLPSEASQPEQAEAFESSPGAASFTRPFERRVDAENSLGLQPSGPPQPSGPSVPALIFSSALTSAIFALLHAEQLGRSVSPLILLFSVSLVLTLVRIRTASVAASALVHASYNFSVFLTMFIGTGGYQHLERLK